MLLTELLDALEYNQYSQYYLKTDTLPNPEIAPLLRVAKEIGVDGIYVFQTSPRERNFLPVRPAVYVAEAKNIEEARRIHHHLWNLGRAPFVIISLPDHIRVYTGFDYSHESEHVGLIVTRIEPDKRSIQDKLADFCAESINLGLLWQKQADKLPIERRVDKRLLNNLNTLGNILIENEQVDPEVAHALIGKYIYIRYLRDRNILSDQWLEQHGIDIHSVLGRNATVRGLQTLTQALETWLNGNIFPLDFAVLTDRHVAQVAAVFHGDTPLSHNLWQLSLELKVYDFEYIPIEMLSLIYEQFLHATGKGKKIGAYYTPEYLADYLLAELQTIKPLKREMNILDPSCGSGIFLVLAYRKLIENELAESGNKKLSLEELAELLTGFYGIERVPDACYITEFSLILTLLHYADSAELLSETTQFKFPSLHNTHIFEYDFFDDTCPLWQQHIAFDLIVGNPPWIKADPQREQLAYNWISQHQKEKSVGNASVAEAFSWRALDFLKSEGYVGLILPATSLYNHGSQKYRQQFFQSNEILRMTDFSNLRRVLFENSDKPAVTMVYRAASQEAEKPAIEHYGPFLINQIFNPYLIQHSTNQRKTLWTITINENDFQEVSPYEAENGANTTWKFALWGTHRDKRAIARLRKLFPLTLGQLYEEHIKHRWYLNEGLPLRNILEEHREIPDHLPFLVGKKRLNTDLMNRSGHRFTIPESALEDIPSEESYIRKGRKKGLDIAQPPHVFMNASWNYAIFSNDYFVIRPRQIGLSAPSEYENHLRALSAYLSSSLVKYYLFFQTPSYGVERDRITLQDVKSIPIPDLAPDQIEVLADLQRYLAQREQEGEAASLQEYLDEQIKDILNIPANIYLLATEFNQIRLELIEHGQSNKAVRYPSREDLFAYARQLQNELDGFVNTGTTRHQITIDRSPEMIVCTVELKSSEEALPITINEAIPRDRGLFARLRQELAKNFSQWVYVKKGLRIFESSAVHIYKEPYLIHWTRTQALNDSDDIIAEALSPKRYNSHELSRP